MGPVRVAGPFNFTAICYTSATLPLGGAQIPAPCRENPHVAQIRALGRVEETSVGIVHAASRAGSGSLRLPLEAASGPLEASEGG